MTDEVIPQLTEKQFIILTKIVKWQWLERNEQRSAQAMRKRGLCERAHLKSRNTKPNRAFGQMTGSMRWVLTELGTAAYETHQTELEK